VHPEEASSNRNSMEPPIKSDARPRKSEGFEADELMDEMVLYSPNHETAISLNSSARAIWELCDGVSTVLEISQELGRRLGCDGALLLPDVLTAVAQLHKHKALEFVDDAHAGSA
jgi:hypothetical protein